MSIALLPPIPHRINFYFCFSKLGPSFCILCNVYNLFFFANARDWRKISLPAMLLGETVNEILQASQVTRDIGDALATKKSRKLRRSTMPEEEDGPKTPETRQKNPETVSSNIKARRKKEKQNKRSEPTSPRARSRIVFKIVSPHKTAEKVQVKANRVSPKHKPWGKKAVLFPNPLFISGSSMQQAKFSRTMSPVIASSKDTKKETPHKFLIKSPSKSPSKFQVRIKSPPKVSVSPNRNGSNLARKSPLRSASLGKKSPPKLSAAGKLRRSFTPTRNGSNVAGKSSVSPKRVTLQAFISPAKNCDLGKKSPSPTRVGNKTQKLSTAAKLRRSFSPSRLLAMRLVSPMKSRKSVGRCDDDEKGMMLSGLRQRPVIVPKRFSMGRIS